MSAGDCEVRKRPRQWRVFYTRVLLLSSVRLGSDLEGMVTVRHERGDWCYTEIKHLPNQFDTGKGRAFQFQIHFCYPVLHLNPLHQKEPQQGKEQAESKDC